MVGVVKQVNAETGFFVVETENGFTVFEVQGGDRIETGDVLSGSLESAACERVVNHSRSDELEVHVRDIVPTLAAAEALLHGE